MKRVPKLLLLAAVLSSTCAESSTSAPSSEKSQRSYPYFHRNSYYSRRPNDQGSSSEASLSSHQLAPPGDIVSSTSYAIRPDSSSSSMSSSDLGSSVNFQTNPLPLVVRPSGTYNGRSPGFAETRPTRYEFPKMATQSQRNRWESSASSYDPMDFRCPPGQDCSSNSNTDAEDDYRSYYSVLNGNQRPYREPSSAVRNENRRYDDIKDSDIVLSDTFHATFPFTVRGLGPRDKLEESGDESRFSNRFGLARPRPTRTSSSAQKWVRLQPLTNRVPSDPGVYDPFFDKTNEEKPPKGPDMLMDPSTYSNRLGVELSPETFAERWGYNKRVPSWLDETNGHHHHNSQNSNRNTGGWGWTAGNEGPSSDTRKPVYGTPYNGPTRDEDPKNWVKLEPIPVAGVSISKWVPKGTQPEHLPTTGNNVRDRPTAWWDRVDQSNKKPHAGGGASETTFKPGMMGWTVGGTSTLPSVGTTDFPIIQSHRVKNPSTGETTSWNDIIYPDDPVSATSSWESTTFKQKFPTSVKMGWNAETARRPAVATWSASGTKNRHRFGIRRPETPSYYPDPHGPGDDPRWMLVSNSKRVTNYGHSSHQHHNKYSDQHRYRPFPDKFRDDFADDEDEELQNFRIYHSNRVSKDFKPTRDDIFLRLNATLNQLEPVLNHTTSESSTGLDDKSSSNSFRNDNVPEISTEDSTTSKPMPSTSTTPRSILSPFKNSFLSTLFRTSRQSNEAQQQQQQQPSRSKKQKTQETTTAKAGKKQRPTSTTTTTPRPSRMFQVLQGVIGKRRKRHIGASNLQ